MMPFAARVAEFEAEIAALRAKYQDQPTGNVVFYGSSSIRMWPGLKREFPRHPPENLGFGGSTIADCSYFFESLVVPRKPRGIVFYAGDNDLALGASVEEVWEGLRDVMDTRDRLLGPIPFAFFSLKPSPSRWALIDEVRAANEWCARELASRENTTWVEIFTPMLDDAGQPRRELFVADELHLSRLGYDLWMSVLRREVDWLD